MEKLGLGASTEKRRLSTVRSLHDVCAFVSGGKQVPKLSEEWLANPVCVVRINFKSSKGGFFLKLVNVDTHHPETYAQSYLIAFTETARI